MALAGCGPDGLSPADRAELDNMWRINLMPKSTPAQLVVAFDRFCVRTPRADIEGALRDAGYVPLPEREKGARAFVIDTNNPAVAYTDSICSVRALARSGQTEAFNDYVAGRFPEARETDPEPLGADIEAAWRLPGPALLASERRRDIDFFSYSLIYYRPEAS
jgi:hypothetical protein